MLRMRWNLRMSSLPANRATPTRARHPAASVVPAMCFIVQAFLLFRVRPFTPGPGHSIPSPGQDYRCRWDPIGPKAGLGRDSGPGLAMLVGAVIGIPGASYLAALHILVTGKSSTATQVIAVVIFVIIDFMLIIIPFAFLELRPAATKARLKHTQDWLLSHARQLMAAIALLLGAYLAISGLIRLS